MEVNRSAGQLQQISTSTSCYLKKHKETFGLASYCICIYSLIKILLILILILISQIIVACDILPLQLI